MWMYVRMRRLSVTMVGAERARTRMWKLYAHGHSKSSLPPTSARSLNGRVSMHEINATLTRDQWLRASPSGTKVTTTSTSITSTTYITTITAILRYYKKRQLQRTFSYNSFQTSCTTNIFVVHLFTCSFVHLHYIFTYQDNVKT